MQCMRAGDKRCGVTVSRCQRERVCLQQPARTLPCEQSREGSESKYYLIERQNVEGHQTSCMRTMNAFLNNLRHCYIEECTAVLFQIYSM